MTGTPAAPSEVQPATLARRWRRDFLFLLGCLVIQGLVNLFIYPCLPKHADPELNKLEWRLRSVVSRYDERRIAPSNAEVSMANSQWSLPYRLMRPSSAKLARYPLLVFLHGAGERGYDNLRQLQSLPTQMAQAEQRLRFPCFIVAPQCPSNSSWGSPEVRDSLIAMINEVIAECPEIDSNRIYLTGVSMGGHGSFMLASYRSELFAAVVPICGGGNLEDAPQLVRTPLWAVHGEADTVVAVAASRNMIDAIRKAGGQPRYSEYPGVGHNCLERAYGDDEGVLAWMFAQAKHP